MTDLRKLARNVALRTGTEAFKKIVSLAFVVFVARKLGADGLGRYSFLLVLVTILGLVADCGFSTLMLREIATRRQDARRLLGASMLLKGLLSGITLGLLWVVIRGLNAFGGAGSGYAEAYIFAIYCILLTFMEMFNAFFVVDQRLDLDAITNIVQRGGAVLLGTVLVMHGMDVMGIGLAFAIATAVGAILALGLVVRRFGWPIFKVDLVLFRSLMTEAVPLALTHFLYNIYFKIDQLMLGLMRSDVELGWYSAAYRIFEVTLLIPSILMLIALPIFSRLFKKSKEMLSQVGQQTLVALFSLGIATSVIMVLVAHDVVSLFGRDFGDESGSTLLILVWTAIPIFSNVGLTTLLIVMGKQTRIVLCFAIGSVANIIMNLILIPRWGSQGAAAATVLTEVALLGFVYYFVSRHLGGMRLLGAIWRPLLCAGASTGLVTALGLWERTIAASVIWLASFAFGILISKSIKWSQFTLFRKLAALNGRDDIAGSK
ncbi:flippase [bacterium]|nr:flippase [bacterium]